jgi:cytochrome c oxidase subunit 2
MRFRAYTVSQADFDSWVAGQQQNAIFPVPAAPPPTTGAPATTVAVTPAPAPQAGYAFPVEQLPAHVVPDTPIPAGLTIADEVLAAGNAQAGFELYSRSLCIGCHRIRGNQMSMGVIGPDLTHLGSRHTIGAGIFPNDARHLALWIKNARKMKPMASTSMPTIGLGEVDPFTKKEVTAALGGLTDQQIADIVAYLLSLK